MIVRARYVVTIAAALLLLMGLAALIAPSASLSAQEGTTVPHSEQGILRRCPVQLSLDETEGTTYHCGMAFVPEEHGNPESPLIGLTYMVLHSTSMTPEDDPVVYLSGGPGASALTEISEDANNVRISFTPMRERRDILIFDQRGDLYSNQLYCSPFVKLYDDELPPEIASSEVYSSFMAVFGQLDAGTQRATVFGTCGLGLATLGRDLTLYNSHQSAQDIPYVVAQAGYPGAANLYGISYGTRLALTAMRDVPESVRSVILDSTYPPQIQSYETVSTLLEEPLEQVFQMCAADEVCSTDYPDIEEKFIELLNRMGEDGIEVSPPITIAGSLVGTYLATGDVLTTITPDLFVNLVDISNRSPQGGFMPLLPAAVDALYEGDYPTAVAILNAQVGTIQPSDQVPTPELQRLQELQSQQAAVQNDINALLEAELSRAEANLLSSQWLKVVTDDFAAQTAAGEDMTTRLFEVVWLPLEPNTKETLDEFTTGSLSEAAAADAQVLTDQMSDEDINETFELLRNSGASSVGFDVGLSHGQNYAVECYEEVPFQSQEREQEIMAAQPYPYLYNPASAVEQLSNICRVFNTLGATAPEIENEPVVSGIPTLIYQGLIDTQTPASWGPAALKYLTDGQIVFIADSGHGVIAKTPCAQWIAAHYFDDPSEAPDTNCIKSALTFLTKDAVDEWKASQ